MKQGYVWFGWTVYVVDNEMFLTVTFWLSGIVCYNLQISQYKLYVRLFLKKSYMLGLADNPGIIVD